VTGSMHLVGAVEEVLDSLQDSTSSV
jgi:hypothetical protein